MALGWMGATTELASVVKNPNSSCSPSTGALFGPRAPRQRVHNPAKANSGRSSLSANHVGVLRGVVGAYSQNDVAGTRQRFPAKSQLRQCGLATLRMLVTGWPPNCGGPGMPQRAMTSSRLPSTLLRTIGASWSGRSPGRLGGCRSCRRQCGTGRGWRPALWFPNIGCTCGVALTSIVRQPSIVADHDTQPHEPGPGRQVGRWRLSRSGRYGRATGALTLAGCALGGPTTPGRLSKAFRVGMTQRGRRGRFCHKPP